ncbi:hypothetical protein CBL_01225 [Carabus blaptoides fortunei]
MVHCCSRLVQVQVITEQLLDSIPNKLANRTPKFASVSDVGWSLIIGIELSVTVELVATSYGHQATSVFVQKGEKSELAVVGGPGGLNTVFPNQRDTDAAVL